MKKRLLNPPQQTVTQSKSEIANNPELFYEHKVKSRDEGIKPSVKRVFAQQRTDPYPYCTSSLTTVAERGECHSPNQATACPGQRQRMWTWAGDLRALVPARRETARSPEGSGSDPASRTAVPISFRVRPQTAGGVFGGILSDGEKKPRCSLIAPPERVSPDHFGRTEKWTGLPLNCEKSIIFPHLHCQSAQLYARSERAPNPKHDTRNTTPETPHPRSLYISGHG